MSKRKDPAAVALGRKGGKAAAGEGARQRWASMTPEEKSAEQRRRALLGWRKRTKPAEKGKGNFN